MKRYFFIFIMMFSLLAPIASATDYYIDPVKGASTASGTSAHPWRTLQEVLATGHSFNPGDTLYLRRGYHGEPVITEANGFGTAAQNITISGAVGHTPLLGSLAFKGTPGAPGTPGFSNTYYSLYWTAKNIFINPEVSGNTNASSLIIIQDTFNISLESICVFSTQIPTGWGSNQGGWRNLARNGATINIGGFHSIQNCYFLNVKNGIDVDAIGNTFNQNKIENFTKNAIDSKNSFTNWFINGSAFGAQQSNVWSYNIIMNAIADGINTSYMSAPPINDINNFKTISFIGNQFLACADPAYLLKSGSPPINTSVSAFEGGSAPVTSCVFQNNIITTNSVNGIRINNGSSNIITNNTCTTLGGGNIATGPQITTGAKFANTNQLNRVYNNIAYGFNFINSGDNSSSVSGSGNNLTLTQSGYATTFLGTSSALYPSSVILPTQDLHLLPSNTTAINMASSANCPISDADNLIPRPRIQGSDEIGAYTESSNTNYFTRDTTAPSVPSRPRVFSVRNLGVDISWVASTDNRTVAGYDIYRGNRKIGRTRIGTNFFDLSPSNLTSDYTIVAFDSSNNFSAQSDPANTLDDFESPTVPTSVFATTVNSSSILVSWVASTDNVGVTGYKIYYTDAADTVFTPITLTSASLTYPLSYTVTGLTLSTTYTFTIKAFDAANNLSDASEAISASTTALDTTPPNTPDNFNAEKVNNFGSVNLSWSTAMDPAETNGLTNPNADRPEAPATSYRIFRKDNSAGAVYVQIADVSTLLFTDTNLYPNTTYFYKIAAVDAEGNQSADSPAVSTTIDGDTSSPDAPIIDSVTSQSSSSVLISWTKPYDRFVVTDYDVYRDGALITNTTSLNYTDTGLTELVVYTYVIRARDSASNLSPNSAPKQGFAVSAPIESDSSGKSPCGVGSFAVFLLLLMIGFGLRRMRS